MGSQRIKHLAQPSDEKIINLEEPTLSDDKGTKELSQHWRCKIILINGTRTMTENLNINNEKIINLADPTSNQDASRKKYVNTVTNNINMTNHYMKNFRSPIYSFDAANKAYVDPTTSSASDPSITKDLNMKDNKITHLKGPISNQDGTTKFYVDTGYAKTFSIDGTRAMTGNLNVNNKKIITLGFHQMGQMQAIKGMLTW